VDEGEGEEKIVISIKNHVMAIHIKNYFLLIQPPASSLRRATKKKTLPSRAQEKNEQQSILN
jgi:hypothetical protein